jgi:hypothetical protein
VINIEGNPDNWTNKWPVLLDTDSIRSMGFAWLFKENDKWVFMPRITDNVALFYNAVFFFRWAFPFGLFFSFRWSSATDKAALFQCGTGWKLNGRLTILTCRIQSDESAAAGVTGANYGQATGFSYGTH